MLRCPLDECVSMMGDRSGWRIDDMLEYRIEYRSCVLGELAHKVAEFTVEIAEKQEGPFTKHSKARVVNRSDRILCLKHPWHQRWKFLGHRLCVCRSLQGKGEGE